MRCSKTSACACLAVVIVLAAVVAEGSAPAGCGYTRLDNLKTVGWAYPNKGAAGYILPPYGEHWEWWQCADLCTLHAESECEHWSLAEGTKGNVANNQPCRLFPKVPAGTAVTSATAKYKT